MGFFAQKVVKSELYSPFHITSACIVVKIPKSHSSLIDAVSIVTDNRLDSRGVRVQVLVQFLHGPDQL
jgi:hypothetical protein